MRQSPDPDMRDPERPSRRSDPGEILSFQEIAPTSGTSEWCYVTPSGMTSLVVAVSGSFRIIDDTIPDKVTEHTQSLLCLRTFPMRMQFTANFRAIVVTMSPWAPYRLSTMAPQGLVNTELDLDSRHLPGLSEIQGIVASTPDRLVLWPRLDEYLTDKLRNGREQAEQVSAAWSRMEVMDGRVSVDELAGYVGWGRRQLEMKFREQIGISPKAASRIVRLRRAVDMLVHGTPAADVAALCGFSDQPHFSREFKALTGFTPRQYLSRQASSRIARRRKPLLHRTNSQGVQVCHSRVSAR